MPSFNSGEIRIYFEKRGEGTPIVFLHGFSLDRRMWQEQMDYFSQSRCVIGCDARGHGKSDSPETGYAREDRTGDLLNLAHYPGLSRFHLVGLSMGGGDGLSFAIDHPDRLISLTLAGTVAAGWQPSRKFRDFSALAGEKGVEYARRKFIASSLANYQKRNPGIKKVLEDIMSHFSGGPWLDPMKSKYVKRNDLKLSVGIRVPTLIMVGSRDILFRPLAKQLHEAIPGTELEVFPDTGHMVNMEVPEEFNERLERFVIGAERSYSAPGARDAG